MQPGAPWWASLIVVGTAVVIGQMIAKSRGASRLAHEAEKAGRAERGEIPRSLGYRWGYRWAARQKRG